MVSVVCEQRSVIHCTAILVHVSIQPHLLLSCNAASYINIVPFVCNFAPFFSQTRIYTSSSSFNLISGYICIRAQDGECQVSEVTLLHVKTYTVVGKIDNLSITRHSVHCSHYVYVQQLMISYFLVQSSAQTSLDFLQVTLQSKSII